MNTETVRALTVTATKPAESDITRTRQTASPAAPQASISTQAPSTVDQHTVQDTTAAVAAQLESYLQSIGRSVQFSVDSESGRTVVSVRDASTGEVIRQIPSEEALRLAQALGNQPNSLIDVLA